MKPYKNHENYISVVYCHEDKQTVRFIASRMLQDGYRIWYEERLTRDTAWAENSERIIGGGRICLLMLSSRAVNSHGFRQRLNFVMRKRIPFVAVYLEEVSELSLGMQLQLARAEKKLSFSYFRILEFYRLLCGMELVNECRNNERDGILLPPQCGYLVRTKNQDYIELRTEEVLLGRSEELCNYVIRDNCTVGRCHATILPGQEVCTLVDNNSLNGTFLNGQRVETGKAYALQTGDRIQLSNEEFIFYTCQE